MKNTIKVIPVVVIVASVFVASNLHQGVAGPHGGDYADSTIGMPPTVFIPDGWVDIWDLIPMAYYWLSLVPVGWGPDLAGGGPPNFPPDGIVNAKDYAIVSVDWGTDPPLETKVIASASTSVYIYPETISATVGQIITVYVAVSSVSNLWAWQAGMTFNPDALECLSVEEGPFLQQEGTTLWVQGAVDNAGGIIHYCGCALIGGSTFPNGTGNLAAIKFLCKSPGDSVCTPEDVILVNSTAKMIPNAISTGTVIVSQAVGGTVVPTDKFGLLAPYVGLASTAIIAAAVATTIYVKRVKRRKEKQ